MPTISTSSMSRLQYQLACALGGACVVLMVGNGLLAAGNTGLHGEVNVRQQSVQQSVHLEIRYNDIVRSLVELSARNHDREVRTLLAVHGINVEEKPAATPTPAPLAPSAGTHPSAHASAPPLQ